VPDDTLERFYAATGQSTPESVIRRMLAELADKIERLDPQGTFEAVELPFAFGDRKGLLRFAPHASKADKRSIELAIQSETGLSTSSRFLDHGTNTSLVNYLRKPEVVADTIATAEELMEALSRNRLA